MRNIIVRTGRLSGVMIVSALYGHETVSRGGCRSGVTGLGAVLAGLGGIVYALRDAPTVLDNVNYEAMGIAYMVAGGVVADGGLTTLISGSLKKGSAHRIPVKTMDGNDLGVSLDVETGAVGLVYSLRFLAGNGIERTGKRDA